MRTTKRLRKALSLACAFISTFMFASIAVHADLIYEDPDTTVGLDIIVDPFEEVTYSFIQILPYVILVAVLIITALLVRIFLKKKDSDEKDNEIK